MNSEISTADERSQCICQPATTGSNVARYLNRLDKRIRKEFLDTCKLHGNKTIALSRMWAGRRLTECDKLYPAIPDEFQIPMALI
jgi:hypothetical protein